MVSELGRTVWSLVAYAKFAIEYLSKSLLVSFNLMFLTFGYH